MPASDYAVADDATARKREANMTSEEHDAQALLARLVDVPLMTASRPAGMIATLVDLAVLVAAGAGLRALATPDWRWVTAVCGALLLWALTGPRRMRGGRGKEPEWLRAAAVHGKELDSYAPEAKLALVRDAVSKTTAGTPWNGAHLYVPPCTQKDKQSPHYGPCCVGATRAKGRQVLVVIGEHLLRGEPALVLGTLAHERRHLQGWRPYAFWAASTAGVLGLAVASWALPWPVMLLAVAAMRVASALLYWAVELACDVGAAREVGPGPVTGAVAYKQRTQLAARARWSPARRRAVAMLAWVASPEHPPYALRRTAIRALAR